MTQLNPVLSGFCKLLILVSLFAIQLTPTANASISLETKSALEQSIPEFLPVDDAYILTPSLADDGLNLNWQIADGYYLYGHNLKVWLDGQLVDTQMPAGEIRYDEFFEKDLLVFYQSLSVQVPVTTHNPLLQVEYQGCADAGLCYPPRTRNFQINSTDGYIIPVDTSANSLSTPLQSSTVLTPSEPSNPTATTEFSMTTLLSAMLFAMLGGIILNLMPCVFPILSLKALGLANSSHEPHRQHLHGWSYTLGSIATFVLIATALYAVRQAGQSVGWGFQLQSPIVISLLVYLFFLMGLSLSGALQLRMSWTNLGDDLTRGHSLKASFFTGALASIVASPCTAPFMGAAMGFAMTQPAIIGLTIFAALGFGMALPFLALSYLPQLHRLLPKPGSWMETLKQAMAFPLYLTAAWLLWVLGHQAGPDAIAALAAGAILLSFAAWLAHPSTAKGHHLLRNTLALIAVLGALALIPQHNNQTKPTNQHASWETYTPERLEDILTQGQPVLVNLTADWCITCLANEKLALDTTTTIETFDQLGVARLKGDWTNYDANITTLLAQHGRSGVPLYLYYPAGKKDPIILPQLLTEEALLNKIKQNLGN